MTISDKVKYVGTDDLTIDLFEGQYVVPEGVSYNSYVVFGGKIAVMDTVDARKRDEWLSNLKAALGGKKPDYLVLSHIEPDHSSALEAFVKAYPDTVVVGNDKTFAMAKKFYGDVIKRPLSVKDGDELDLGSGKLKFVFTPMVHWPEVMMTFMENGGILFSADAFGKFGAVSTEDGDWACEARRYYFNIVGKYGTQVQNALKKLAPLGIKTICPLHGPVLSGDLGEYLSKYDVWSSYRAENEGVTIAYGSVYGNTFAAVKKLEAELKKAGVKVSVFDLARCDVAEAIEDAFRYDRLILASPTIDGCLFPAVASFIDKLKSKNYQGRKIAFIENGSWAPTAAKLMRTQLETLKNVTFAETVVTVESALSEKSEAMILALAKELA